MKAAEFLIVENQIAIMRALKDLVEDSDGGTIDFKRRVLVLHDRIEASETELRDQL